MFQKWLAPLAIACGLLSCQAHPPKSTDRPVAPLVYSVPSASMVPPAPALPTAVEQAIAEHRSAILAQHGVVAVESGALPDGSAAVFVEMCAPEAMKTLTLPELSVPVNVFVDPASKRASSKPCGCANGGAYYDVGEGIHYGCSSGCTCRAPGRFECRSLLFDCSVKIFSRVHLKANSAEPVSVDAPLYAAIIQILVDNPGIVVEV